MKILNLHNHILDCNIFDQNKYLNEYKLQPNEITEFNSNKYFFSFKCKNCSKFYDDYQSYYRNKYDQYNSGQSIFICKNMINNFQINNNIKIFFEFVEFYNFYLIGTKNEIISYICEQYNKLKEKYIFLDSNIKNKEKDIAKIEEKLRNEKTERNRIENNLKKEKEKSAQFNLELKKLESKQENIKKNLDLKENEIKNINNLLNKEKIKKENILKKLQSEKDKNKELNDKSLENNKNIMTVLSQLENEKKLKNDLELKYSQLQKQEKEKDIRNKDLEKYLDQKEIEITKLTKNNKDLGINVEKLKNNLNIKEKEIKEINNSLKEEKNIKENILQVLKSEEDKNKKLNNKLDNISIENNKNVRTVLTQLENEKQSKKELELKFSELQKQEKLKNERNEQLEKSLENKDKELKVFQNNQNFGLKFESDSKNGEYDIILDITSFQDLVDKDKGWIIKYNKKNGKENYEKKKDEPTIIVGVIGNGNKGKSFFLEKLSGYNIPKGFNIKTEGLSIRFGTSQEHNVAILDSAGQETPLLKVVNNSKIKEKAISNSNEEEKNIQNANSKSLENGDTKEANEKHNEPKKDGEQPKDNNNPQKTEQLEDEDIEFEKYSRDKLITEFFLQKFIIWK